MSAADRPAAGEGAVSAARPKKKAPPEIKVRVSWCKGCGLCVDYCKTGAIEMDRDIVKVVSTEKCTRCLQCEHICPDFAIEILDSPAPDGAAGA